MQIRGLPSSGSLAATDVLAKDASGGTTEKINGSNLASSIKTLGSLLGTSDIVNSFSSTATDKPLAAAAIHTLWSDHLSGLHIYHFSSGSINISANADTDIDFSSAIPQGVSSPWAVLAWVSSGGTYYSLPYITNSGVPQTWVYGTIGGTKLRIHSTVAWSNSTVYLVLITF